MEIRHQFGCWEFLSTPSARRATSTASCCALPSRPFLSTPSARRATSCALRTAHGISNISIHALREEGDNIVAEGISVLTDFYPRPPRGGRRHSPRIAFPHSNFYPRPPRGGRLREIARILGIENISIHALREEGDSVSVFRSCQTGHFYPRPPRGGRRHLRRGSGLCQQISIHALREEGDRKGSDHT